MDRVILSSRMMEAEEDWYLDCLDISGFLHCT